MLKMTVAIVVHLVLLALACTSFTLVTGWVSGGWKCNFYAYCYADGWGHAYRSDYTLPTVITYLAAYAAGLAVYGLAWGAGSRWVAGIGLALSMLRAPIVRHRGLALAVATQSLVDRIVPRGHGAVGRGGGLSIQKGRIEQRQNLITR